MHGFIFPSSKAICRFWDFLEHHIPYDNTRAQMLRVWYYIFFKSGFNGKEKARDLHTNLTCFSLGMADKCSFTDYCLELVTWPGCIEKTVHGYSWNHKCLCHWEERLCHLSMIFMKASTIQSTSLLKLLSVLVSVSKFMAIELLPKIDAKSGEIAF